MAIPKYYELFNFLLTAIKDLGGEATNLELEEKVAKKLQLTDQEIAEQHPSNKNQYKRTELQYQLAWARTYLKVYGLIDSSKRGAWLLTTKGKAIETVDASQVMAFVNRYSRDKRENLEKTHLE